MPPSDYPHWVQHQVGGIGHDSSIPDLYESYLEPSCTAALGSQNAWHCSSVHNLYRFLKTPVFVMENQFDSQQIVTEFEMPSGKYNNDTYGYVEYFGNDMTRSIMPQLNVPSNTQNGLFFASCFDHTAGIGIGPAATTKINSYDSSVLVGDWFWNRNSGKPRILFDTCGKSLPCNPTCTAFGP